jgi:hypothetical protein
VREREREGEREVEIELKGNEELSNASKSSMCEMTDSIVVCK